MTRDGELVSLGFGVHLIPCDTGTCLPTEIADACHDRVRDDDETDVDCGGSCRACGFDAACAVANDCQSRVCDTGTCAPPTCSDGIQDGFETGIDCGGLRCGYCAGDGCSKNDSCHSKVCNSDGKCE